ncbi:MAG: methyltransferase domain-containing protein [Burkholderiales bacterium]
MTPDMIRAEVDRLAKEAASESWCPGGGWQFPFDFGNGLVAPTYTPTQAELHPWRREVMLRELDALYAERYGSLSVLDLGAGEAAMSIALWERGVRDITCVEVRPNNIAKARFVASHFGADLKIVEATVEDYLQTDNRKYDLVLFMGLLYHLLDPFAVMRRIGDLTGEVLVIETVLARPMPVTFANAPAYSPTPASFFVREDTVQSHTAGTSDLELWPTPEALFTLLRFARFRQFNKADYGNKPPAYFATDERILGIAIK